MTRPRDCAATFRPCTPVVMPAEISPSAMGAEHPDEQIHQARLFALFSVCRERIEREEWHSRLAKGECLHRQLSSVAGQARLCSKLFGATFCRFQHRMEVILLKQFGTAEIEHVCVDSAAFKLRAQPISSAPSLADSGGLGHSTELSILKQLPTVKGKQVIHPRAKIVELGGIMHKAFRSKRCLNKLHREISCLRGILSVRQSVVDALPF